MVDGPRLLNRMVWPVPVSSAGGRLIAYAPVGVTSMMRAAGSRSVLLSSGQSSAVSAVSASDRYDTSDG